MPTFSFAYATVKTNGGHIALVCRINWHKRKYPRVSSVLLQRVEPSYYRAYGLAVRKAYRLAVQNKARYHHFAALPGPAATYPRRLPRR